MLKDLLLKNKRVFLRADLNVPLSGSNVSVDHKLTSILPTIDYIQSNGGKIILATHIGRPNITGDYSVDKNLSTKILIPWFEENGYKINFVENLESALDASSQNLNTIFLLENLRFFRGEKEKDENFAKKLASLADVYVNDAFGVIHRDDTSITLLPKLFKEKSPGLLIEKELKILKNLKYNPKKPFVLVLGGDKVKDKIPLIQNFIDLPEPQEPSSILIGGAIAYTFLKANGQNVGLSLIDEESIPIAKKILLEAQKKNIKIVLPRDSLITLNNSKETVMLANNRFQPDGIGVDIGLKTIDVFIKKIEEANTIFLNGTMGIYTNPSYASGTKTILKAVAKSRAFRVIGGGDAVAAVYKFNLKTKFDFLSTGGGATLKFLSLRPDEEITKLPGLKALK